MAFTCSARKSCNVNTGSRLHRLLAVAGSSTAVLIAIGATGAWLGGAGLLVPVLRVLLGGWVAMGVTFGVGAAFGGG
jgi:vacuolar iron transporter family protein